MENGCTVDEKKINKKKGRICQWTLPRITLSERPEFLQPKYGHLLRDDQRRKFLDQRKGCGKRIFPAG